MPPRKVDERKTRKALRKLRRAVDAAQTSKASSNAPSKGSDEQGGEEGGETSSSGLSDCGLSDWEKEFTQSVEKRLETFGSAFTDPSKGALDEPLSARQAQKLAEIGRKARGKGLKRTGPIKAKRAPKRRNPRDRHIEDELPPEDPDPRGSSPPDSASSDSAASGDASRFPGASKPPTRRPSPAPARPPLRVIKGGKSDDE